MVAIATKQSQGYVLRLHGNGEVFVEDVYKYLNALDYAYNCAYVLDSITQQAEELARQYEKPPIPLRNLLWTNWWPPDAEKVARLVPDKDRLKLRGVKLNSPGFWDFMGKLNPLEVLRQYLNDRHEHRKDREYRELAEAKKLDLENERLEVEVFKEKFQLLREMGANEQDIVLLKDQMLNRPLQGLNPSQDQGLIIDAQIVDPELEKKKSVASWSNQDMVAISDGTFMMGAPEGEGSDYEKPQHEVAVQAFYMSKYPITQAQYQQVMGENPSSFKGDERPVERVSWNDAVEFCQRLSQQTGAEYRLPTEAEWEYACRAGTTTKYYFGDDITSDLANCDNVGQTTAVGKYSPNAFGLYDMHGNVWEWCEDDWHINYENAPNDGSAWLSEPSSKKVIRGGSWLSIPADCRSAYRYFNTRDSRGNSVGFRVVCVAPRAT